MSVVFDPKYAFLIYSPLAYLLDKKVGKKLILTTVIAEWLNQILKWLLHGERPYWYVHSSGHFDAQQVPIKQFPITCELGPGHPSGHAMVTAAVWYIILDSLLHFYNNNSNNTFATTTTTTTTITTDSNNHHQQQQTIENHDDTMTKSLKRQQQATRAAMWLVYGLILATVSVSRVFLGCHFPHQCLAGAILGLALAKWVSGLETQAHHFIGTSLFVLITAFGSFGLLQMLGFDPSWTIRLATSHCIKREYIHLDTAPFFSIMRYSAFALGTGLGLWMPLRQLSSLSSQLNYKLFAVGSQTQNEATDDDDVKKHEKEVEEELTAAAASKKTEDTNWLSSQNVSWFSVKLFMALLMARLVDNLGLYVSHASLPLFYSSAYLAYTLFSYAFINLSIN